MYTYCKLLIVLTYAHILYATGAVLTYIHILYATNAVLTYAHILYATDAVLTYVHILYATDCIDICTHTVCYWCSIDICTHTVCYWLYWHMHTYCMLLVQYRFSVKWLLTIISMIVSNLINFIYHNDASNWSRIPEVYSFKCH